MDRYYKLQYIARRVRRLIQSLVDKFLTNECNPGQWQFN